MLYIEKQKELEVLGEYDVIVCGGGPAGVCAGLASARAGLKTLLVEQSNCLGGMATIGLHQKIAPFSGSGGSPEIVGGIPREIINRSVNDYKADIRGGELFVDMEELKYLLDRMAEEANLELLYYTQLAEVIKENDTVKGVIVTNKSGRFAAYAKRVIDCTGDADAAFRAGCPITKGRPGDGKMQPVTLMYRVGGVDWAKTVEFRKSDHKLIKVWEEAIKKKYMRPFQTTMMGLWWVPSRPTEVGVNFTHMHLDGTNARDLTTASIEGRKQVKESVYAMQKLLPGFEKSYLIDTAGMIGVRETRRIVGKYTITVEDIKALKIFEDSIGLGSAFIDIHNVEGSGMDKKSGYQLPHGGYYSIPYRTMVPESVNNIIVAGRCHSATHEAAGSTRWMSQAMVMGEAAGAAAFISIKEDKSFADITFSKLKEKLLADKTILK